MKCAKCRKEVIGITCDYQFDPTCAKCAGEKADIMNTEKGEKIKCTNLHNGYDAEKEIAKRHLTIGGIYTVEHVCVSGWGTEVEIQGIEGINFNSVFFERC